MPRSLILLATSHLMWTNWKLKEMSKWHRRLLDLHALGTFTCTEKPSYGHSLFSRTTALLSGGKLIY